MHIFKHLISSQTISLGLLTPCMLIATAKWKDSITVPLTRMVMIAAQVLAFIIVMNQWVVQALQFKDMFSLTLALSVTWLGFNAALHPHVQHDPLNYSKRAVSIVTVDGGWSLFSSLLIGFAVAHQWLSVLFLY